MKRVLRQASSSIIIIVITALTYSASGQDKKIDRTFNWTYQLGNEGSIAFENYDCDLIIHTWDNPEVKYNLTVVATFPNAVEAGELEDHIRSLNHSNTQGNVSIKNRFWITRKNIAGIKSMRLDRRTVVRYRELEMKGELWIPADADLKLTSKYSAIDLEDMDGNLDLKLYNDKLYGKIIGGDLTLEAKYSTVEVTNVSGFDADLYDCEIQTGDHTRTRINSKYSNIVSKNVGDIEIESYNDKFKFQSTGDLKISSKYTELSSLSSEKAIIDSYDGTFNIENCKDIRITSKYTKYFFGTADDLLVTTSYTDVINANKVKSINITESKYGKYKVSELSNSFNLETGYEDKITLSLLKSGFTGINLNGKYIKSEIGIPSDFSYRIKANLKYPHLDIKESGLTVKIKIMESSQLEYEAVKGTVREDLPVVNVTGYEMRLKIVDLPEINR